MSVLLMEKGGAQNSVSPGHILDAICAFGTKTPPSSGGSALLLTHLLPFLLVKPLSI